MRRAAKVSLALCLPLATPSSKFPPKQIGDCVAGRSAVRRAPPAIPKQCLEAPSLSWPHLNNHSGIRKIDIVIAVLLSPRLYAPAHDAPWGGHHPTNPTTPTPSQHCCEHLDTWLANADSLVNLSHVSRVFVYSKCPRTLGPGSDRLRPGRCTPDHLIRRLPADMVVPITVVEPANHSTDECGAYLTHMAQQTATTYPTADPAVIGTLFVHGAPMSHWNVTLVRNLFNFLRDEDDGAVDSMRSITVSLNDVYMESAVWYVSSGSGRTHRYRHRRAPPSPATIAIIATTRHHRHHCHRAPPAGLATAWASPSRHACTASPIAGAKRCHPHGRTTPCRSPRTLTLKCSWEVLRCDEDHMSSGKGRGRGYSASRRRVHPRSIRIVATAHRIAARATRAIPAK